jgi:hypothetical protein
MADKNVPFSWYAILNTDSIQPYLDMFELMKDPRLERLDVSGQQFGKLTYSAFDRDADYEVVLYETQGLVALLTGTLRIRQGGPGPLSIVNIIGVFEDGREEKFPPHGRPVRIDLDLVNTFILRMPGAAPRPTTEQYIMEYVIRSGNRRVKDVLHYLSNPPDFFNLYKILEVITKDLGKGSKNKGFSLIKKRGWAIKKDLDAFNNTANNVHRHWKENRPAPKMNLQEAVLMSRRIIEGWIAELAGLQLPPHQSHRR